MRLKSAIFASALVRRVFSRGDFAVIERKGAEDAGAIFVRQVFRDGSETLYAPAPQSFFEAEDKDTRLFEPRLERASREAVGEALDREVRFDPDLWVVTLETDDVAGLFDIPGSEAEDPLFRL
ncbi:MAG: DUF1491 family protein [Shinella sp.]|nr:DUF1491 family protein [Shinella sp.]